MDRAGIGVVCVWLCIGLYVVEGQEYVNVATGKTYNPSSGRSPDQGSPDTAANENTNDDHTANCTLNHPSESNTWWQVDLNRTYPVNNITIWASSKRMYEGDPLSYLTIAVDGETCAPAHILKTTSWKQFICSDVIYGQTVRITRQVSIFGKMARLALHFCEIQIWVPKGVSQCPAGKYGSSCEKPCSTHCGKGPGRNFCCQTSGHCYDGCADGWYGAQCSTACSPGCPNNQCDEQTGQCAPCSEGYTGDNCAGCADGWYGAQCSTACSPGCPNNQCDEQTGQCAPCSEGYTGDKCSDKSIDRTSGVTIGTVTGVGMFTIPWLVYAIIWFFRKRKRSFPDRNAKHAGSGSSNRCLLPPTTATTAETGQTKAVYRGEQGDEDFYEIAEDGTTFTTAAAACDKHVDQSEAAHPYDHALALYRNTGDVHLYV